MDISEEHAKAPSIFICHSHRDKVFARRLARDLYSLSILVWIDDWRLAVGDSLHQCIGKALEESAYVGVLLSPDSIASRWCKDELEQALTREKRENQKVVLPLLYRRITPPPFLEGRLYLNFSKSYWISLARLAGFLHMLDQQVLFENLERRQPGSVEGVHSILQACGLAPETVLPVADYLHLIRIFEKAGVEIPGDKVRFILPETKRGPESIEMFDAPRIVGFGDPPPSGSPPPEEVCERHYAIRKKPNDEHE